LKKKFLLVSEGPTDYVVIKEVAKKISSQIARPIEIKELSPRRDATSGTYPPHGWGGIRAWCLRNGDKDPASIAHLPPSAQQFLLRNNWKALVAFEQADGLIIQLDTDIAHELNKIATFNPGDCRKSHCNNEVLAWLNEPALPNNLYLALTSFALETWLLATHPPTDGVFSDLAPNFDYEEIHDVEDRLIKLGYSSKVKNGRKRVKKSPFTVYEPYGKLIAQNLASVRSRCAAAEALCHHLEI